MGNETSTQVITLNPVKESAADGPEPREAHAACSFREELWIVGGARGDQLHPLNEAWVWSPKKWRKIALAGSVPEPRAAPGYSFVAPHYLVLFGGTTHARGWTAQVYVLDLAQQQWIDAKTEGFEPSGRDKTACCSIGTKMYIFGGFGPRDASKRESDRVEEEEDEGEGEEEERPEEIGVAGISGEGGDAEADDGERPQVDGPDGQKLNFGWSDELWELDCSALTTSKPTLKWNLLSKGTGPTPRAAAAIAPLNGKLFLFGGRDALERRNDLWSYNLAFVPPPAAPAAPNGAATAPAATAWSRIDTQSVIPPARSFHSLISVGLQHLLLFGGLNLVSVALKDFHLFDTEASLWVQPKMQSSSAAATNSTQASTSEISARGFHSCTFIDSRKLAVFFGGSAGSADNPEYFNELVTLSTESILSPSSAAAPPASANARAVPPQKISLPAGAPAQLLAKPAALPTPALFAGVPSVPAAPTSFVSADKMLSSPAPPPLALWKPAAATGTAEMGTVRRAESDVPEGTKSPALKKAKEEEKK